MLKIVVAVVLALSTAGCGGAIVGAALDQYGVQTGIMPREVRAAVIVLKPDAPDAGMFEPRTIAPGSPVLVQRVRARRTARLGAPVSVRGATLGDADIPLAAGTPLVAATDGTTDRYFCAEGRRPGLFPITMWACFEDADQDGRFESAGQALPDLGSVLPMLSTTYTMFPVDIAYMIDADTPSVSWELAVLYDRPIRNGAQLRFVLKARISGETEWRDPIPTNYAVRSTTMIGAAALPGSTRLWDAQFEVLELRADDSILVRVIEGMPETEFVPSFEEIPR